MNHWWFLGHSWLFQLKQHGKVINKSRSSFSRLFCVLVVKGRGSGEMMSPHSLHRRTPNTATARPLCCVWSRKLTGLWNQTAAIWSPHATSLTLEWNSYWATKLRKRSPQPCEQDNDNHYWLKKHTKRTFGGDFLPSDWRKTALKEENPSVAKVSESWEQVQWAWKLRAFRTLTPPLTHLHLWATEHRSCSNAGRSIVQEQTTESSWKILLFFFFSTVMDFPVKKI